jgi:TorA maturation chaperone TorD
MLITGHDQAIRVSIAQQRDFFQHHIASWVFSCCTAIRESTIANYYARVAEFTEKYMALDRDALAMDD